MPRIIDLTLPVVSGMAGIPNIPLYDKYPVKVQAVTVDIQASGNMTLHASGTMTISGATVNIN